MSKPLEDIIQRLPLELIEILPINIAAILGIQNLLFHHKDPFDRILIAQTLTENLSIISIESIFDNYGVDRVW